MKRSATDVLRRGFLSTIANWQLLLIRIAEGVVFLAIAIATVMVGLVPPLLAIWKRASQEPIEDIRTNAFAGRWGFLVYLVLVASVMAAVLLAIHSFVQGGSIRTYADAEARASGAEPRREEFAAFDANTFFAAGRATWWPIFWIYNIVAAAVLPLVLLPLLPIVLVLALSGGATAGIVISCFFAALAIFVVILIAIAVAIWSEKAIVVCVVRGESARASTRIAWREVRADLARHLLVAFILGVLAFAASGAASSVGMTTTFSAKNPLALVSLLVAPMQLAASFLQTILSTAVGCWFLAAYVSLTTER